MHNHNDKENSGMMWVMMICCVAPILLILFSAGGKTLGISIWITLGVSAIFIIAHFLMMKKSHQHTNDLQKIEQNNKDKKQDPHSDRNCCH